MILDVCLAFFYLTLSLAICMQLAKYKAFPAKDNKIQVDIIWDPILFESQTI